MGTTLIAMQTTPGVAMQWVVAIEGVSDLLTDGPTAPVVTAWSGSGWSSAIGGLFIEGSFEQQLDPWRPFSEGSDLDLIVRDATGTDAFGKMIFAGDSGIETELLYDTDADETTLTMRNPGLFPPSGEVYIGIERIGYAGRDLPEGALTGCTRGLYAPFKANTESNQRFGHMHRSVTASYAPDIKSKVTSAPRTWIGKWVGLWAHRRLGTTLDVKAQAQLIWAGKIINVRDTDTGDTRITCKHVLSVLGETTLMRDQWSAEIQPGVYIAPSLGGAGFGGPDFEWFDQETTTVKTANNLVVKTSGASGANQINAGYYSAEEVCSFLNRWLEAEANADRLYGRYLWEVRQTTEGTRVVLKSSLVQGGAAAMKIPGQVWTFLGFEFTRDGNPGTGGALFVNVRFDSDDENEKVAEQSPWVTHIWLRQLADYQGPALVNTSGIFYNQSTSLPAPARRFVTSGYQWGLLVVEGLVVVAELKSANQIGIIIAPQELQYLGDGIVDSWTKLMEVGRRKDEGAQGPITVKQIVMLDGAFADLIPRLFASTGTTGYNHATYDSLGYGLGAAVPWELLGQTFLDSCTALEQAQTAGSIVTVIEKATKLADLVGVDLLLRGAFLVWRNGGLRFTGFSTPTAARATVALSEANKATPRDQRDKNRAPLDMTDRWLRNIVKIEYNRLVQEDRYKDSFTLEDRTSIDDLGGDARPVTLKARNSYGQFASTGEAVQALAAGVLARMPFLSRPMKLISRTIDFSLFEDFGVGVIVLVSDNFVRDPSTGVRGIGDKPGIVMWHSIDYGGADAANPKTPRPPRGEIHIAISNTDRCFAWAPAARVDETRNTGGFTAGYDSVNHKISCKANEHSDPADSVTDTTYFAINDAITVVEIDPSNPASPQSWNVTISAKSGNELTLSAALSGFDTSKLYRVVPRDYSNSTTSQRLKAYQADDQDGQIQDLIRPNTWGQDNTLLTFPTSAPTELGERYATISYGDGKPMDVGYEHGIVRTLQNLLHYKTAPQAPSFDKTPRKHTTVAGNWKLWSVDPIYCGPAECPGGYTRYLYVAPFARSTSGTHNVRVTLMRFPPAGDSLDNVAMVGPFRQVSFAISSSTFSIPTALGLDTVVADSNGEGYLIVEVDHANIEAHGLGTCYLGPLEPL